MKNGNRCKGMTLIELMVALVIGSILITAVYQALIGHERTYQTERQNIRMQYDARTALEFITHELMMTGHGVAAPAPGKDTNNNETKQNINVFDVLINNAKDEDGIDDGTDAIVFAANVGYGSVVAASTAVGAREVKVYAGPSDLLDFTAETLVNIIQFGAGCKHTLNRNEQTLDIVPLKIEGVTLPSDRTPVSMPWLTTLSFNNGLSFPIDMGSYVTLQPLWIRYRVRNGVLERSVSTDGQSWPLSQTQALISNVEDLQLAYAFDDDGDGNADTGLAGNGDPTGRIIWAVDTDQDGNLDTELPHTVLAHEIQYLSNLNDPDDLTGDPSHVPIVSVKMSIVVRSERQNPNPRFRDQYRPLPVQDHVPASTASDGFRRRFMEREVRLRNLL